MAEPYGESVSKRANTAQQRPDQQRAYEHRMWQEEGYRLQEELDRNIGERRVNRNIRYGDIDNRLVEHDLHEPVFHDL